MQLISGMFDLISMAKAISRAFNLNIVKDEKNFSILGQYVESA